MKKRIAAKRLAVPVKIEFQATSKMLRMLLRTSVDKRPLVNPMKDLRRVRLLVKRGKRPAKGLERWTDYLLRESPTRVRDIWKAMLRDKDYADETDRKAWHTFYAEDLPVLAQYGLLKVRG